MTRIQEQIERARQQARERTPPRAAEEAADVVVRYARRAADDLAAAARGVRPTADERRVLASSMQTYLTCRLRLGAAATLAERGRLELRMRAAAERMGRVRLGQAIDARSLAAATAERWAGLAMEAMFRVGLTALDLML